MKHCFIILALFAAGCSYFKNPPEEKVLLWPLVFDSSAIAETALIHPEATRAFYSANHYTLVWMDSGALIASGDSLVKILHSVERYGLISGDYHGKEIDHLLTQLPSHERSVSLDLYLTDSFFALHHALRYGRVERKSLVRIVMEEDGIKEGMAALNLVLAGNPVRETFNAREPVYKQYQELKRALGLMLAMKPDDTTRQKQVKQLAINMERWRWQDLALPDRYIRVNSPSFSLQIIENDTVVVESKVIVGKAETPTPELESIVRSFTIYPYWHVPQSIVKEVLPHIREDTMYLKRHNYDVLDQQGKPMKISSIDWQAYEGETFPYILRQREGSENTMGIIKFLFSNNYGVYLHDTNSKRLFSRTNRALSHGCIRVQKAVDLARYLIRDDHIVSPEDLDQYLMLQHRMDIRLIKPIALYLQYFTCEVKNGKVVFYEDIYDKDEVLINALYRTEEVSAL